jgi:G3E family GTPase
LARKQIALSDRVVLTKGDLVSVDQAAAATRQIKALLGGRPVDILRAGEDWDALVSDSVDFGTRRTSFFADAADHDADITAFPVVLERPVPWDAFVQAIRALVALRGRDVLRVKGILAVEDCRGPVLFHAVQHLVHEPVELEAWPDDERQSRLIFITRGVDQAQVTNLISAMVGLTASVP